MYKLGKILVAVVVLALAGTPALGGAIQLPTIETVIPLTDHPDGAENPPPYGMRFDNLFLIAPTSGSGLTRSFTGRAA